MMHEPPRLFSREAEQAVIGRLLLDPTASERIGVLKAGHFYSSDHRLIFSSILSMISVGKEVDVITVAEELHEAGSAEETGGLAYLGELAANTPSAANIGRYAETVVAKALERQLMAAAVTIQETVSGIGTTQDKLQAAQSAVMSITEGSAPKTPKRIGEILTSVIDVLEKRNSGAVSGISTGFSGVDQVLSGGLRPGNLIIVAGRPAMGKTALSTQIGLNIAKSGKTILLLSMEMSDHELVDRLISNCGNVALDAVLNGRLAGDEGDRIMAGVGLLHELPIIIDDQGGLTLFDVASKARSVKRKHGLSLLVVDYLQLMSGDGDNRNQQIEQITRGLKSLAKELEIPVIVLSQLSRKCEERTNRRPIPSDLRESGAIEQDADIIIFVYRDEVYNPGSPDAGTAEVIFGKNRQGGTGMSRLAFIGAQTKFADLAYDWQPAPTQNVGNRDKGFARKGFNG